MTDRIDHAAESREWIGYSEDLNPQTDWPRISHATTLAATHATLALVEQQRIANLITLWMGDSAILIPDARFDQVAEDIREALGL